MSNLFYIMTNYSSACGDPAMAGFVLIIKRSLTIIQIIVPIILIISVCISLTQMLINPDEDKKPKKALINKVIAAVCVFLLPMIINVMISWVPDNSFNSTDCWKAASEGEGIISWNAG